jgi:hypothetical protein
MGLSAALGGRPGAYVRKAKLLEQLAHTALVIVDPETDGDDLPQVDPPPR